MSVLHKFLKTKFCSVAPNISGILAACFHSHTIIYVISHVPSKKRQITVRFTGRNKLWVLKMVLSSCHPSSPQSSWKVSLDFWKIFGSSTYFL